MNKPEDNWTPDPQMLAAYFDGELEGRDAAEVRNRLEAWLDSHPDAVTARAEHRRLERLWEDTTPKEPSTAIWNQLIDRIDQKRKEPLPSAGNRPGWRAVGIIAASIGVMIGAAFGVWQAMQVKTETDPPAHVAPLPKAPVVEDGEVLLVASASEITILRIEGTDDEAVVVGQMPVSGPLELADSGEVCINCPCPRVVIRQDSPHRPMVWARND